MAIIKTELPKLKPAVLEGIIKVTFMRMYPNWRLIAQNLISLIKDAHSLDLENLDDVEEVVVGKEDLHYQKNLIDIVGEGKVGTNLGDIGKDTAGGQKCQEGQSHHQAAEAG